jgi:hypothetical protein
LPFKGSKKERKCDRKRAENKLRRAKRKEEDQKKAEN